MKELDQLQLEDLPASLQSARENRGFSLKAAAELLGIPTSRLRNYERGNYTPTLPELESLSFIYQVPIFILKDNSELEKHLDIPEGDQIQKLINIRNQIIRTHLQIAFEKTGLSQKNLSHKTGIPPSRIKRYLNKNVEIPLDDLAKLNQALNLDQDIIFDNESPVGKWQSQQILFRKYKSLPEDLREFLEQDDSQVVIRAARSLMEIEDKKMREILDSLNKLIDIRSNQKIEEN